MRRCLGKLPPEIDARTLKLRAYVRPELEPLPRSADYTRAVTRWPMYGNDRYGDCTCAAAGHMIQCWSANAGRAHKPTTAQVIAFYAEFTEPGPENGCAMLSVLRRWQRSGLAGDRIGAFATLSPKNRAETQAAIALFGACYIGLQLPRFVTRADDMARVAWELPARAHEANLDRDPDGGHCVPAFAYDDDHLHVVTWGARKRVSWSFYERYADEAYAVLSTDALCDGRSPRGLDVAALRADLARL